MLAIRLSTAAVAVCLVALALSDHPFLGGDEGFAWSEALLLAAGVATAACCFAAPAWNAKALTVLVSLLVALGAAELALRAVLGSRYYSVVQLDERLLYRLAPGAQREFVRSPANGGERIRFSINSQGFRGPELAPARTAPRVLVYGDSFVQAEFSPDAETFTARLEERLSRRLGRRLEVVNAGVAGYGPDQELRRMQRELPALRPDLVVVALYAGNDFGDLMRNKLYRLSADGSLADNPAVSLHASYSRRMALGQQESILKKLGRDAVAGLRRRAAPPLADSPEARRSRTEQWREQMEAEYVQFVVQGDNVVRELLSDPYNADVSLTPESDSARYKVALMRAVLAQIGATAAASGVPLAIVLIPSPIDAADEHDSGEVDRTRYPAYRRGALTDILAELCRAHALPVLNLFGPFWEQRARALYFRGGDDHWNAGGQDYAAELLTDFIAARGLLRAAAPGSQ